MPALLEINRIVVHSSATTTAMDIGVADIRRWHLARGWFDIGYQYVIRLDGIVEAGRDIRLVGAHARGYNTDSVGICLVGGLDEDKEPADTFSQYQKENLRALCKGIQYWWPGAEVLGHRDLPWAETVCPSFDVREWWESGYVSE